MQIYERHEGKKFRLEKYHSDGTLGWYSTSTTSISTAFFPMVQSHKIVIGVCTVTGTSSLVAVLIHRSVLRHDGHDHRLQTCSVPPCTCRHGIRNCRRLNSPGQWRETMNGVKRERHDSRTTSISKFMAVEWCKLTEGLPQHARRGEMTVKIRHDSRTTSIGKFMAVEWSKLTEGLPQHARRGEMTVKIQLFKLDL